ncbi:hypothetical protein [Nocardia australiensis]|uniref:hypothetical protein n=1 Tax=Nocardia australiensis TaxID=2887191 RepID=UPI001D15B7E4|nr:hypothetical protein [Nocardia australiensis]
MSCGNTGTDTVEASTARRWRLRAMATAATLAATTAAIAVATPSAGAAVRQLGVFPENSYGLATNYGTGCHYTLRANLTQAVDPVYFYDNGVPLGSTAPQGGVAFYTWSPTTPGVHTLSALQLPNNDIVATVDIRVATGVPVGWACVVVGS